MWQPNRWQWRVIWIAATVLLLAWPPPQGRSLALKVVNWLVDPGNELPTPPPPLPMGLGDDGDAVAEHDRQEQAYFQFYDGSAMNRWRLRLKFAEEPLDPRTERQLLAGAGILAALGVWRLNGRARRPASSA